MPFLLHLHGYNSSPDSLKVQQTEQWLRQQDLGIELVCPALSPFPCEAIGQIEKILQTRAGRPIGLVGSSMGGFLATWLAQKYQLKAALINPAVRPYRFIERILGPNTNSHTGEQFILEPHHLDEFRSFEVDTLDNPQDFLVLLQTGDEVLDYREAEQKYHDCHLKIEQGGDHGFQHYPRHLPEIIEFLQS